LLNLLVDRPDIDPNIVTIYIVTTNDLLSLDVHVCIMYENELLARNNRPFGTNTIELRMMICMGVRDFHYTKTIEPKLEFFPYILKYINDLVKPRDPKIFEQILKLEIINSQKLSFITPEGELTPRGILFIELNTKGSYIYLPSRNFDVLFNNFMTVMQFPNESYFYSHEMPPQELKPEEEVEEEIPEEPLLGDLHIKGEDFAAFLEAMHKKQLKEAKPIRKRRVREP
jgi:hypothetical protein